MAWTYIASSALHKYATSDWITCRATLTHQRAHLCEKVIESLFVIDTLEVLDIRVDAVSAVIDQAVRSYHRKQFSLAPLLDIISFAGSPSIEETMFYLHTWEFLYEFGPMKRRM